MSKGKNQKRKLTSLKEIMLYETDEDHAINIDEVKRHLSARDIGSARRSLYDDFRVLEDFGVEIVGETKGRSYYYRVINREFELAELKLLVDAIQSAKFITEKKSRELINKIKKSASKYQANQLQRQVYIHDRVKTMNESIYYSVDSIHEAITNNKQITFDYCEWNKDKKLVPKHKGKRYRISPWAVSWNDGNYYLVAYDSNPKEGQEHIKHYRVDKMKNIIVSNNMRDGREIFEKFDIGQYTKMSFGMYGGKKETVWIEFPENKIGIFIDRFGKEAAIRQISDDTWVCRVEVMLSRHFYGWIFSLGNDVKIAKPTHVVEEMREYLKEQLDIYAN